VILKVKKILKDPMRSFFILEELIVWQMEKLRVFLKRKMPIKRISNKEYGNKYKGTI